MSDAAVGAILALALLVGVPGALIFVLYLGKTLGDVLARRKIEELERQDSMRRPDEPGV